MRGADLEAGEAVERALEDQVRQRDRRFERVADRVGQQAVAGEPAARLQFAGAERVHEDEHAHAPRISPRTDGISGSARSWPATLPATPTPRKPRFLTACSTCSAARSGYCSAAVAKATKRSGWLAQNCDELLVLDADQLGGGVALGAVPERVDAERLDIDAGAVHLRQPGADIRPQQSRRLERVVDDLGRVRDDAMRMHIDGLDALAGDDDFPAALRVGVGMPLPSRATPAGAGAGSGAHRGGELAVGEHDPAILVAGAHFGPPLPAHARPLRARPSLHPAAAGCLLGLWRLT